MNFINEIERKFSFLVKDKGFNEPSVEFKGSESYLTWQKKSVKIYASCHNYYFNGFPFFSFEIEGINKIFNFDNELKNLGIETIDESTFQKKPLIYSFFYRIFRRKKYREEIERRITDMSIKINYNYSEVIEKKEL